MPKNYLTKIIPNSIQHYENFFYTHHYINCRSVSVLCWCVSNGPDLLHSRASPMHKLRFTMGCSIFCLITGPEQQLSGESEDDIGLNTQHCTESAAGREVRRGRLALCSHRLCERASGRVAAILAARPGARGGAAGGDAGWLSHCRAAQPVSDIRLHCWWEGRGWRWRRGSVASGGTAGRRDQSSARAGRSST